jgi:hypothetical protein
MNYRPIDTKIEEIYNLSALTQYLKGKEEDVVLLSGEIKAFERELGRLTEEIESNYTLYLESLIRKKREEIDWLKELLKLLKKDIEALNKQKEIVEKTEFEKIVVLEKTTWLKPIEYAVVLHEVPLIEKGEETFHPRSFCKTFSGDEAEKEANNYAETIVKEHKAELLKREMLWDGKGIGTVWF